MSLSTMPPTWMYRGIGHDIALPDPPRRLGYALVANATNHQEPPTTKKHHPLQHLWEHPFPAKIGHVSQCRVPPSPSNSTSSSPHKVMLMFHSSTPWSFMFDTPIVEEHICNVLHLDVMQTHHDPPNQSCPPSHLCTQMSTRSPTQDLNRFGHSCSCGRGPMED